MSAITPISSTVADSGATVTDLGDHTAVRLTWHVGVAVIGNLDFIVLELLSGPSPTGPWTPKWNRIMAQNSPNYPFEYLPRVTFGGFDQYLLAKWAANSTGGPSPGITISLDGDLLS